MQTLNVVEAQMICLGLISAALESNGELLDVAITIAVKLDIKPELETMLVEFIEYGRACERRRRARRTRGANDERRN